MFSPVLFYSFCSILFYYILSSPFPCGQPTLPTGVLRLVIFWIYVFCPDLSELIIFIQDSDSGGETNLFRVFFEFIFFAPDLCEPVSAPVFRPISFLCSGICPLDLFLLRHIFPGFDSNCFFFAPVLARFYSGFPSNLFSLVRNACECKVRSWQNIFRILFDFFSPLDRTLWIPTVLVWELYVPNHGSWQ